MIHAQHDTQTFITSAQKLTGN